MDGIVGNIRLIGGVDGMDSMDGNIDGWMAGSVGVRCMRDSDGIKEMHGLMRMMDGMDGMVVWVGNTRWMDGLHGRAGWIEWMV